MTGTGCLTCNELMSGVVEEQVAELLECPLNDIETVDDALSALRDEIERQASWHDDEEAV